MSRSSLRSAVVAGAAAVLVGVTALPALAHVTVSAAGATPGGFTVLTFRVPTESDTASTTGVTVQFPADQPLAFASVRPKAGWTYTVTKATPAAPVKTGDGEVTEYTSVIEWKAAPGAGIRPGEFDEFQVSAGPLPEAESMTFKAIQTYSDGRAVPWIEVPAAGSGTEPEFPAPTLTLAAAAGTEGAAAPEAASTGSVTGAYVLGGLGLVAGLGGLALGATRRRPLAAPSEGDPVGTRAD